jgi:alkanesulfonate monooxygenase SsuD/methylene tetrahydromethanopterin reductase-like flavin-dependent oxidoreductase (luciferase family)
MARSDHPMLNDNKLKLGLFSANCSGGMAVTTVPERWQASWENNLALARAAEEAGFEFLLPIARWGGYGGETDFQGWSLETITWATGLLANTRRISVFATAHTAFFHPLVAAKQFATMDQIGGGRFGLNIVCGWNLPEYEMFGLELPDQHDVRYGLAQEWYDVVRAVWTRSERFDWNGRYFSLKQVYGNPKPFAGLPPVMNAGSSTHGREFAVRNADFFFTVLVDLERGAETVRTVKELARGYGRSIEVFTTCYVVCRPTKREAEDYHAYYVDECADWPAVDRLMSLQVHTQSFPHAELERLRRRFAGGHGTYPLVGDPDHIAEELKRISEAGFAGTTIAFVNYLDELPYFVDEVMPRLRRMGLRSAAQTARSTGEAKRLPADVWW